MTTLRHDDADLVRDWLRQPAELAPIDTAALEHRLDHTPQQRRLLPPLDRRFPSMFSATKYLVAGAIVALFGGFLLNGMVQTERDGDVPAASVIATASPELTREPDDRREDFRPGIERITSGGAGNDLDHVTLVAVADDGTVWGATSDGVFRLGGARYDASDGIPKDVRGLVTGPDGRVIVYDRKSIAALEDGSWRPLPMLRDKIREAVIAADGTPWVTLQSPARTMAKLDGQEWTYFSVGDLGFDPDADAGGGYPQVSSIATTPDGSVWAGSSVWEEPPLRRFDGERWHAVQPFEPGTAAITDDLTVDPDGTLWASFHTALEDSDQAGSESPVARWDGNGWTIAATNSIPMTVGTDGRAWSIRHPGRIETSSDGTSWTDFGFPARAGFRDPVARSLARAPDGSIWVSVGRSGGLPFDRSTPTGLYRIDPLTPDVEPVAPPDRTLTTGPLAGAVVREAAPGVDRVIDDGSGTEPAHLGHVAIDRDGDVWVAHEDEVRRIGSAESYGADEGIPVGLDGLRTASDGSLIAYGRENVAAFDGSSWSQIVKRSRYPIVFADRATDGSVWVGVDAKGVLVGRLRRGSWTWYGPRDLGVRASKVGSPGAVRGIAQTEDGLVWVGTADGLSWFDGKTWRSRKGGDRLREVLGLAVAPDGSLAFTVVDSRFGHRYLGRRCTDCNRWSFAEISDRSPAYQGARTGRIVIGPDNVIWFGAGEAISMPKTERSTVVGDAWADELAQAENMDATDIAIGSDGSALIANELGLYLIESPRSAATID